MGWKQLWVFVKQEMLSWGFPWILLRGLQVSLEFLPKLCSLLPPAKKVWGKVIFSVACVKNSVHGRGSASVHAGIPPGAGIPQSKHPPPGADPPNAEHAGRYGQQAGGTHPTGMQSCFFLHIKTLVELDRKVICYEYTTIIAQIFKRS